MNGGEFPSLRGRLRITIAHEELLGCGVAVEAVTGNGMEERLFLDTINPLLIALHAVTRIQYDGGFVLRDGHVEAHGSFQWSQVLVPTKFHVLFSALIRLVADARPHLEALVLPPILSIDAEIGTQVAKLSLRKGLGLDGRIMLGQIESHLLHEPGERFAV